jgi:hypothetical protein
MAYSTSDTQTSSKTSKERHCGLGELFENFIAVEAVGVRCMVFEFAIRACYEVLSNSVLSRGRKRSPLLKERMRTDQAIVYIQRIALSAILVAAHDSCIFLLVFMAWGIGNGLLALANLADDHFDVVIEVTLRAPPFPLLNLNFLFSFHGNSFTNRCL